MRIETIDLKGADEVAGSPSMAKAAVHSFASRAMEALYLHYAVPKFWIWWEDTDDQQQEEAVTC